MKVIALEKVDLFIRQHPEAETALQYWVAHAKDAQWRTAMDVKAQFRSASIIGQGRVVFNIHGNDFRLLAKISYEIQVVFIEKIGTHSEYNKWRL